MALAELKLRLLKAAIGVTEEKVSLSTPFNEGMALVYDSTAGAWKAGDATSGKVPLRVVYFGYGSDRPDVMQLGQCKTIVAPCVITVSADNVITEVSGRVPTAGAGIIITGGKYAAVSGTEVPCGMCLGVKGDEYEIELY
jgi:small ligand-binding sensory domain FIST